MGLGNYAQLLGDERFWAVLGQTVWFAAACVVATLAVGAGLAVLLTRVGRVPRLRCRSPRWPPGRRRR